ncbi:hypothetical protein JNJ66_01100 [Candidatus Saccharibacteria bacterium]|nr:hypothetical protein [Candidatus Saccharibacteria bacterium]
MIVQSVDKPAWLCEDGGATVLLEDVRLAQLLHHVSRYRLEQFGGMPIAKALIDAYLTLTAKLAASIDQERRARGAHPIAGPDEQALNMRLTQIALRLSTALRTRNLSPSGEDHSAQIHAAVEAFSTELLQAELLK